MSIWPGNLRLAAEANRLIFPQILLKIAGAAYTAVRKTWHSLSQAQNTNNSATATPRLLVQNVLKRKSSFKAWQFQVIIFLISRLVE